MEGTSSMIEQPKTDIKGAESMKLCKDCKFFGQTDLMYRYDRICTRPSQKEIDPVYGNLTGTALHCESERRYGACGKEGVYWEAQA